jgi:pimeloyl-ACP methyl ester carboxylesterase
MSIQRHYQGLPFSWEHKSKETIANDCGWLASIIDNAAPFSDWWTKARIVQLAYPDPSPYVSVENAENYEGLGSEADIVQVLQAECDPQEYPDFAASVDEDYIIATLNCWHAKQFTQAIARNFEVYADRQHSNVFLVTSTAPTSAGVPRQLPDLARFRPLFNVDELSRIARERGCDRLTLRTHGYSSESQVFYANFLQEAMAFNTSSSDPEDISIDSNHFYIGYQWPSEKPLSSPGLWGDPRTDGGILFKFLFVLAGLAGIGGTLLYLFLRFIGVPLLTLLGKLPGLASLWEWMQFEAAIQGVKWIWIVPTVFMLWGVVLQFLRVVVYQRDRYRAIHYGAPDLAEFFWRFDKGLNSSEMNGDRAWGSDGIIVNLLGHSMGALVLVNALRILSDRFGKDDIYQAEHHRMGQFLQLDKLILVSPDIPLELVQEGRNNYVRSSIRRCRQIFLLSSDRDIVLRYLSMLANWFSEPSFTMSGLRLGNLYLAGDPQRKYRLSVRNMIRSYAAVQPTSAYDLFEQVNYFDCSTVPGLNGVGLPLNRYTALAIDLANTALYLAGKVDVHGAYFWTSLPTFQLLKKLIATAYPSDSEIRSLIAPTPIRYLPSPEFPRQTASVESQTPS